MGKSDQDKSESTEQRIFDAAHELFTQKGLDGAKMQDIADRAGINKALLHYYYRSKEKLYEAVTKVVLSKAMPSMRLVLEGELPLFEKIDRFVDTYVGVIRKNPFIPLFIISEINKHPERFSQNVLPADLPKPHVFFKQIQDAAEKGEIRSVDPRHLVMNMISLCVFPFIARPMLQMMLGLSTPEADVLMDERKNEIKSFIFNALRP